MTEPMGETVKHGHRWKGGTHRDWRGYVYVLDPLHPNANKNGYVREHRKVMADFLKRPLKNYEVVHHKNGIKYDNRLKNLEVMRLEDHTREHLTGVPKKWKLKVKCRNRKCSLVGPFKLGYCSEHYQSVYYKRYRARIRKRQNLHHSRRTKNALRKV